MTRIVLTAIGIWLLLISAVACILTIIDKRRARLHRWRIPEATLLTCGFLGGAFAELVTMLLIRHKTKHARFMVGLPLMCVLHLALLIGILYFMR